VTDGPFPEAKEVLAGYWLVDVESEARAVEIAKRVASFTREPIEVRQVMGPRAPRMTPSANPEQPRSDL
jgi:hypothetical protein